MNINYINEYELEEIISTNNTILIVKKEEDQVFKMMKAQVSKLRNFYKDKFKYFVIDDEVANKVLNLNFTIFPELVIMKKTSVVGCIRGFRKVDVPSKLIELNF